MEAIAKLVIERDILNLRQSEIDELKGSAGQADELLGSADGAVYLRSLYRVGPAVVAMARTPESQAVEPVVAGPAGAVGSPQRRLVVLSTEPIHLGFHGVSGKVGAVHTLELDAVPVHESLAQLPERFGAEHEKDESPFERLLSDKKSAAGVELDAVERWRYRWLWALVFCVPLALGLSYPAVFTAVGVSLAVAYGPPLLI